MSTGMSIRHHPSDAVLMAYGAGALPETLALVVACHIAQCPRCAAEVARLEAVGGALLEEIEPAALADDALEAVLARLDAAPPERPSPPPSPLPDLGVPLPAPLRARLARRGRPPRWRTVAPGVRQIWIDPPATGDSGSLRLIRVAPGRRMPRHGHPGLELTLVLAGGYSDALGNFGVGDMVDLTGEVIHQPVIDPGEDCVCLVAMERPIAFSNPALGLLSRFLKL